MRLRAVSDAASVLIRRGHHGYRHICQGESDMMNKRGLRSFWSFAVAAALICGMTGCTSAQDRYMLVIGLQQEIMEQRGIYTSPDESYASDEYVQEDNWTDESSGDLHELAGLVHKDKESWTAPDMCKGIGEVSLAIESYVLAGCTDELVLHTEDVSESDIRELNEYMTQPYACGKAYEYDQQADGSADITITLEYDDSYYVYMYIVYGVAIPDSSTRAKEIYDALSVMYAGQNIAGMSDYDKEKFYHDYMIEWNVYDEAAAEAMEYVGSFGDEDVFTVYGMMVNRSSVCDAYAKTMYMLLNMSGVGVRYVTGFIKDSPEDTAETVDMSVGHAWNMVKIDGQWYQLDATWDDMDDEYGIEGIYAFFNVPDGVMDATRVWNTELYPECNFADSNYYVKNGAYMNSYEEFISYTTLHAGYYKEAYIEAAVGDYDENVYCGEAIESDSGLRFDDSYLVDGPEGYTVIVLTYR